MKGLFRKGTKTAKAFEQLETMGVITIRDLCSAPYFSNGANKIIQSIKERLEQMNYEKRLQGEWVVKNGSRFKEFYLQTVS